MELRTTPELWSDIVRDPPDEPAYLEEQEDGWRPVPWSEAAERVDSLAHGLLARGVKKGDRVAVLSRTRLEWILLDWAVMSIGAVVVGLYPTSSAKECEYVLAHSEAVLAFAEDEEQARKLVSIRGSLPALREIIPFDWLDKLESDGRLARHLQPEPVDEDDLATLIYTSGTTGPPKGCMLTHRNLVTAATCVVEGLQHPGDTVLLFLPMAHSYARLAHQAGSFRGATIALVADVMRVPEALVEVRPTILPAVPRVYEKVHANTFGEIERAGGLLQREQARHGRAAPSERGARCRACSRCSSGWLSGSSSPRSASGSAAGCASESRVRRRSRRTCWSSSTRSECRWSRATA
jgi:long-chain acyl-CoA synthetase